MGRAKLALAQGANRSSRLRGAILHKRMRSEARVFACIHAPPGR
jgi:hypothetical protein